MFGERFTFFTVELFHPGVKYNLASCTINSNFLPPFIVCNSFRNRYTQLKCNVREQLTMCAVFTKFHHSRFSSFSVGITRQADRFTLVAVVSECAYTETQRHCTVYSQE